MHYCCSSGACLRLQVAEDREINRVLEELFAEEVSPFRALVVHHCMRWQ